MHSHASRGYPWPSHGLYLTSLSLVTLVVFGAFNMAVGRTSSGTCPGQSCEADPSKQKYTRSVG